MQSEHTVSPLSERRLKAAKFSFAVRRVPVADMRCLIAGEVRPEAGDLCLATVEKLGHHTKLELANGRRAAMFVGDEIVVCYGNRYASAQFEAYVGETLAPCHLVIGGGVIGTVKEIHAGTRRPTRVVPIGLLARADGTRLNLRDHALRPTQISRPLPVVAVVGTNMRSGKTTVAANIVRGLTELGFRVGAAKLTGTGAGRDLWSLQDAGADPVLDFTDAGHASTYMLSPSELDSILDTLLGHLSASDADVVVVEIADGLLQKETHALLGSERFRATVDAVVFAADGAVAAVAGARWLKEQEQPLVAISGTVTRAPLAIREIASWSNVPVIETGALAAPGRVKELLASVIRKTAEEGTGDDDATVVALHPSATPRNRVP